MVPEQQTADESELIATDAQPVPDGFGAEFRELAQQRRFLREGAVRAPQPARASRRAAAPEEPAGMRPSRTARARRPADAPRDTGTRPVSPSPSATTVRPGPEPRPARSALTRAALERAAEAVPEGDAPRSTRPGAAVARQPRHDDIRSASARRAPAARLTDDPYSVIVEMSRMADRVIDSREQLAAERARAERAERDLQSMNERIMAARGLVHEAQRTAHAAAERAAYLEGRCEALQDALDQTLRASLLTKWRWRRMFRKQA